MVLGGLVGEEGAEALLLAEDERVAPVDLSVLLGLGNLEGALVVEDLGYRAFLVGFGLRSFGGVPVEVLAVCVVEDVELAPRVVHEIELLVCVLLPVGIRLDLRIVSLLLGGQGLYSEIRLREQRADVGAIVVSPLQRSALNQK